MKSELATVLVWLTLTGITCKLNSCPDDTVEFNGCKCRQTRDLDSLPELICDGDEMNFATVIKQLNDYAEGNIYRFESLQWENGVPVELKNSFFGNVTFRKLQIGTPLHYSFVTQVRPKAFSGPIASEVEWFGIRSYELNKEKDLFKAISVLKNLEYLAIEGRYLSLVPENAFNKDCEADKCKFQKLKKINFTEGIYETFIFLTRLEKEAFYNLPSLEEINMRQQDIGFIGDFAFASPVAISDKLRIDLSQQWNRKFNPDSFGRFALSDINREVELNLYGNSFITYLPEEVFRPLLDANPNNTIRLGMKMNCSCEMQWLYSAPEKYEQQFIEWSYIDYEDDNTTYVIQCQDDINLWSLPASTFENCTTSLVDEQQQVELIEQITLDGEEDESSDGNPRDEL